MNSQIKTVTIAAVALFICLSIIALAVVEHKNNDAPLATTSTDRATLIKGTFAACVTQQQSAPENKNASEAAINAFCTCYGNSMADVTTMDELQYTDQHRAVPLTLATKIRAAHQKCAQTANKG